MEVSREIDPDLKQDLLQKWLEIVSEIKVSRYEYSLSKKLYYDDHEYPYDEFNEPIPNPRPQSFFIDVSGSYNNFSSPSTYSDSLNDRLNSYKTIFITFIDSNSFSVGERINYFLDRKDELVRLNNNIFRLKGNDISQPDTTWKCSGADFDYDGEAYEEVDQLFSLFIRAKYDFCNQLLATINDSLHFIPGRLAEYTTNPDSEKLNFDLSKSELILLLMSLRDKNIIKQVTDYQLARFAEKNFLYKYNSIINAQILINQFKNRERSPQLSLKTLNELVPPFEIN